MTQNEMKQAIFTAYKETFKVFLIIGLICMAFSLIGCSGGSGSDSSQPVHTYAEYAGSWLNTADNTTLLTINGSGNMTDSTCGYVSTFSVPNSSNMANLTIASTNGTPGCMPVTTHTCEIVISSPYLMVDCGGAYQYQFIKQ